MLYKEDVMSDPIVEQSVQSVQDEFKTPCKKAFAQAVESMKFLVRWHDKESLFQELRDVVEQKKSLK